MKIGRLLVFLAVALTFGFATPSGQAASLAARAKPTATRSSRSRTSPRRRASCAWTTTRPAIPTPLRPVHHRVALCLNQTDPNDPKCTPHPPLTSVTVDTGQPLNVPDLSSTACGTSTGLWCP